MSDRDAATNPKLTSELSALSASSQSAMRAGLHELEILDPNSRRLLLDQLHREVEKGSRSLNLGQISDATNIDISIVRQATSAFSIIVALVTQLKCSSEEFVSGIRSVIAPNVDESVVGFVVGSIIDKRDRIDNAIAAANLASSTIPSFEGLELAIDLRINFKELIYDRIVPVVVARFYTDTGKDHFFQLTKADLERCTNQMQKALDQVKIAEQIAAKAMP